jgi:hypothetical protein
MRGKNIYIDTGSNETVQKQCICLYVCAMVTLMNSVIEQSQCIVEFILIIVFVICYAQIYMIAIGELLHRRQTPLFFSLSPHLFLVVLMLMKLCRRKEE